jgi:type III restriction enzyme
LVRYAGRHSFQNLGIGQAIGGVDEALKCQMIRRTIEDHLKKERRLAPHGIKVLSLFFIDSVERYRKYDKDGKPEKGDYATLFDREAKRRHQGIQALASSLGRGAHLRMVGKVSADEQGLNQRNRLALIAFGTHLTERPAALRASAR